MPAARNHQRWGQKWCYPPVPASRSPFPSHICTRRFPGNRAKQHFERSRTVTMNRDTQVGLALAILLIGVVGAMFLRNQTTDRPEPVQDSRSLPERPPPSIDSPRRAEADPTPPRVSSVTSLFLSTHHAKPDVPLAKAPQPEPKPQPEPQPEPKLETQPTRVALSPAAPPAPPLPSTRPVRISNRHLTEPPDHHPVRQPGTPPHKIEGDVDRPPLRIRFRPSRHPLTGRRVIVPGR